MIMQIEKSLKWPLQAEDSGRLMVECEGLRGWCKFQSQSERTRRPQGRSLSPEQAERES